MDDVVMVACGGGAFRIMDCAGSRITIPKVIINSNENSVIPLVPEGVRGRFLKALVVEGVVGEIPYRQHIRPHLLSPVGQSGRYYNYL